MQFHCTHLPNLFTEMQIPEQHQQVLPQTI